MDRYDDIVVGSGASGLTAAFLLAVHGHKVLVLEKGPRIGGSLTRFRRDGVSFDTGFHFTGGLSENGLLREMLTVLGIMDSISPIFFVGEKASRFVFESEGMVFDLPPGFSELGERLKGYFPNDRGAVDRFFDMVRNVCVQTGNMRLDRMTSSPDALDEDFISLQEVLDGLTDNDYLKALLCGYCMCHGVRPSEISFANHSRMCFGLYESVARVDGGGEAFIRAFKERFEDLDVNILCGTHITQCLDIRDDHVGRFVLNTGEEVSSTTCVLTIHPKQILEILPKEHLSKAFIERVSSFEDSAGFFSVFGVLDSEGGEEDKSATIVSLFPSVNVDQMLDPSFEGDSALVVIESTETVNGRACRVVNAFEPSFPERVEKWADSRTGKRPPEYLEYKAGRLERVLGRIAAFHPGYEDRFRVLDAATVLTFRDYLHSHSGSAYGVKQKIGQFNLVGKLPLRNMYAAGQSAVLPGLMGAMVSSFIVARAIVGKEALDSFIGKRLESSRG